mgnify:FL=1
MKQKSSTHSHKASTEDEKKILADLQKLKSFSQTPGRFHKSFVGISSDLLDNLDEEKFCAWLQRHQKNIAVHFPAQDDSGTDDEQEDVL